jgi:predicted adenine nucleotide alpha hydrolase (AANH) superfamily ATPase
MLVHICCSVDSHYFLQKLQQEYPKEELVGFFYDPNIHPYSEYYLRLLDVKRSCALLGIVLIEGEYDTQSWLEAVKGLEHEPEKGARCAICFDKRFEVSAKKASELGHTSFTSTLLTSPKKSLKQLQHSGDALAHKEGIIFVAPDYRKASGTQEQNLLAKQDALYRQDYCGCLFGLTMQRDQQNRLDDELFTPLSGQQQPESIEERIALYEKRWQLETENRPYKITKERFLNYRLLYGYIRQKKETIPAHFLPYSTIKGDYTRGKIEYSVNHLHYFNRSEVKFITLQHYNNLLKTDYTSIKALLFKPPPFETECNLRTHLGLDKYSLSTIAVVNEIPQGKLELILQSKVYEDVKEVLHTL